MNLSNLTDDALFGRVEALARTERFTLVDLLLHLGELDARPACQRKGYSSSFAYLTRRLGYSESDAMRRVRTARAARRFPSILRLVSKGDLNLVGVALIEPLLTPANHEGLIRKACRRSTREIERLVAELSPPSAGPRDRIRALPPAATVPAPAAASPPASEEPALFSESPSSAEPPLMSGEASPVTAESRSASVESPPSSSESMPSSVESPPSSAESTPSSPEPTPLSAKPLAASVAPEPATKRRGVFTFTADEEVHGWYEQARDLLRHRFPEGAMEDVIGESLRRLVETELAARRAKRPKKADDSPATARRSPKWVEDIVWRRDGGRCAHLGPQGLRCGETAWLELDHVVPWARGGRSDDPRNIRLLCRAHNQSEAARLFGDYRMGG
ncbi:MAG: HNH endonuclease signature motif containing protein [Elusimicrobiota bacterium]|nr:HNH endonuclease signature motif containing protein [Elusimicrobiota bacterium]